MSNNNYTPPDITPERYVDLLDFYHYANLTLQQLHNCSITDPIENESVLRFVNRGQYYANKVSDWLTPSWHNNQAYFARVSEFGEL